MMNELLHSKKLKIVGAGAGGHCRVLLDLIDQLGIYEVVALTDHDEALHGQAWEGVTVVGGDNELLRLYTDEVTHAFVGLGSVGDHILRKRLYDSLVTQGFQVPVLVHPAATVARNVELANGVQVMAGVVINPNVKIGCNAIINTSAVIEHDCVILDHVHVSPGAVLGGNVKLGEGSHIGIGSTIREGIQIGKGATVAAGAVVVKDVAANDVVMGVPAKSNL